MALKEIALKISQGVECSIILMSPILEIPPELEKYITILEMDILTFEDIRTRINKFVEEYELYVSPTLIDELAMALKGLTEFEIMNILALAYGNDGEITKSDISLVFKQKQQMIKKSGILEMIPIKESMNDVGGLENLKNWLKKKSRVIKDINKATAFGVDIPKGVLIAGVPGCGKSLNAKAAAKLFELPLLRLDLGRIMGKYVGESEANMRKAIALAEAISPCVLWLDELEKAFAGIGGDGGGAEVTTRLLGTFLTWMQEKTAPVFVVATANNVMKLPSELLRKGRFDDIFFVGLPNDTERRKIFEIHIGKRRKQDLGKIEIEKLVEKTKGYSGADIEGVVCEAIEDAFTTSKPELTTEIILNAIKHTHSLSEIMKEPLETMSKEYEKHKFKNASLR
jgi:SpoVK/Ycf46/Vps4 family AAA+-type ATPase